MKPKLFFAIFLSLLLHAQKVLSQTDSSIHDRLRMISSLTVNGNLDVVVPEDSILRNYLKIELITEAEFLAKRKVRVNYLVADTLKIRKKNGILRLPTATGSKTYKDKLVDNDGREEYDYLGQVPSLNAYVIQTMFWEVMEYTLVSKKNGVPLALFSSMPYLSPDKKKIISVYADPYETESEISLHMVINNNIKSKLYVRFKYWMPGDEQQIFWAPDGKFYLPIQFSDQFWNKDGDLNTDYRYIRISLL